MTPAKVFLNQTKKKKMLKMSTSGCDSVGIAVASDTRDPRFKFQIHSSGKFMNTVNCIEKAKILKKRSGTASQLKFLKINFC